MQKNERTLLDAWVKYHAALFGIHNIFIFDNGSDHPDVVTMLDRLEAAGAQVDRSYSRETDYSKKGDILGKKMRELRDRKLHDFFFPIDVDEFLVLQDGSNLNFEPEAIHEYLSAILVDVRLPHIRVNYLNQLGSKNAFLKAPYQKVFFQAEAFLAVDHGNHLGTSAWSNLPLDTKLAYIHCHAKPFPLVVEHARDKLSNWCDVDDPASLSKFGNGEGVGHHLVKYLLSTEAEYLTLFDKPDGVKIPGFAKRLQDVAAEIDFLGGKHSPSAENVVRWIECDGVTFYGVARPQCAGTPIVITGEPCSAIRAVLEALVTAGIAVSNLEGSLIDERWWRGRLDGNDLFVKQWLLIRAAQKRRWAVYCPHIDMLDRTAIEALRRPRVVVVSENVDWRSERQRKSAAAIRIKEISSWGAPIMSIQPSTMMNGSDLIAESLMAFCGIGTRDEILTDVSSMLRSLDGKMRFEGWIDNIREGRLTGWCWRSGTTMRPSVALYLNGTKRATLIAEEERPDLAAAGVGDGRHGFTFSLSSGSFDEATIVDVRVEATGHRLGNSGGSVAWLRSRA